MTASRGDAPLPRAWRAPQRAQAIFAGEEDSPQRGRRISEGSGAFPDRERLARFSGAKSERLAVRLTTQGKAEYVLPMRSTVSSKGQITVPRGVRERLGLIPGTPVGFEFREEGVLLRKRISGRHPIDKGWATLRPGRPVDEILDEMRGPDRGKSERSYDERPDKIHPGTGRA